MVSDLIDCRRGCEGAPISDSSSSKLMEKEEDNSDDDVAEEDESEKEEERTRRAMEEADKQHRELMQIMSNRSEYQKFTTRTRLFKMSTVSVAKSTSQSSCSDWWRSQQIRSCCCCEVEF